MDLGGWLRSLGLEQYEAAFRENAIDAMPHTRAFGIKPSAMDRALPPLRKASCSAHSFKALKSPNGNIPAAPSAFFSSGFFSPGFFNAALSE